MLKTSLSSTCIFCIFLFVYDYQISSVQASFRVKNSQPCALYTKNNRDLKAKDIKEHLNRKSRLSHHGHHDHSKVIIKPSTQATARTKPATVHHFKQKDSKDSYLDWKKRHVGFESYAKRLNLTLVNGTEIVLPGSNSATITSRTIGGHKTTSHKNFITTNNTEEDNELGVTSKNDVSISDSTKVDVLKRNQEVIPLNLVAAMTIKPRNDIQETTLSLEQQCKIQNDQLQSQRSATNQNIRNGGIVSNVQTKPMEGIQSVEPVLIKNAPQRLEGDRQIIPGSQEWNERVQEAHVAQAVQDAERVTMHSINKNNKFAKLPQISNAGNQVKGVTDLIKSFSEVSAGPKKLAPRTILTKVFIIPIQEEMNNDNVQSALKTANEVLDKNMKRSDLKKKNKINSAIKNKKHDTQNVTTPATRKEKSVSKKKSKEKVHHAKKLLHASNRSNKHKKPAPKQKTHHGSEHKRKKYRKHKDKKTHKHKKKKKPHRKHKEETEDDEREESDDDDDDDQDEEDS